MVTHGLDVHQDARSGTGELFAVNHGGRQSIEICEIRWDELHGAMLTWKGCVILPSDLSANAVAALPDGMVVTSFGTAGAQGTADLLAGRPSGFVARWTPHKGWTHVPGSDFGGDNGVAVASDASAIYVNDWSDGTLRLVPLRDGIAPARIELGHFHPDNVHTLADDDLLIAGQVGTAADIIGCVGKPECKVGSMIVIVDPRTRRVLSQRIVEPTPTFAAASTALLQGRYIWLSRFRGDRIVRVLPE